MDKEHQASIDYHVHYRNAIDRALGEPRGNGDLLSDHLRAIERLKGIAEECEYLRQVLQSYDTVADYMKDKAFDTLLVKALETKKAPEAVSEA